MKYDVEEYTNKGEMKSIYAITTDGKPIGLTLPASCGSVEMGREFLAWCDGPGCCIFGDKHECTKPYILKIRFDRYLAQRKRERLAETCESIMAAVEAECDDSLKEPEETAAASEYVVISYTPSNTSLWRYRIEHVKSSNLVSKTFENSGDASGFLKWWPTDYHPIHKISLAILEQNFKNYKAETAEVVEYVCYWCKSKVAVCQRNNQKYLVCFNNQCAAISPEYDKDSQPDERWIRKPQ